MTPYPGLRPHPWSRAFAWTPRTGPFVRLSREQAAHYDANGFIAIEDALAPELVAELIARIDPLEARVDAFLREQPEQRAFIADARAITFTVNPAGRDARLRELISSRVFAELAHDLLGGEVRLYWDQAVYKKSERPAAFGWHQDNAYGFVSPQGYLTFWIALNDATRENGCLEVLPGLHALGTLAHATSRDGIFLDLPDPLPPNLPAPLALPLRAGSLVAMSSLLPHRTGPNNTPRVRKAYIVQCCEERSVTWHGDARHPEPERREPVAALPGTRQWRLAL
ncbi:MAG TPA: phytanoyl-CoA dioxygenase family protein [Myxococcota bacterium]|jgi:ectoine hydroxylase-related dioxygenase (phytanoyl-CoA dioxygenase family)